MNRETKKHMKKECLYATHVFLGKETGVVMLHAAAFQLKKQVGRVRAALLEDGKDKYRFGV